MSVIVYGAVVTEKTTQLAQKDNKLVYAVSGSANKIEIKKALEELYGVAVKSIQTYWTQAKTKLRGRGTVTKRKRAKRAIVEFQDKSAADILGSSK